ncbi:MAG: hypothetical protein ACK5Z5_05235 [Neisseriaceae bacterium]
MEPKLNLPGRSSLHVINNGDDSQIAKKETNNTTTSQNTEIYDFATSQIDQSEINSKSRDEVGKLFIRFVENEINKYPKIKNKTLNTVIKAIEFMQYTSDGKTIINYFDPTQHANIDAVLYGLLTKDGNVGACLLKVICKRTRGGGLIISYTGTASNIIKWAEEEITKISNPKVNKCLKNYAKFAKYVDFRLVKVSENKVEFDESNEYSSKLDLKEYEKTFKKVTGYSLEEYAKTFPCNVVLNFSLLKHAEVICEESITTLANITKELLPCEPKKPQKFLSAVFQPTVFVFNPTGNKAKIIFGQIIDVMNITKNADSLTEENRKDYYQQIYYTVIKQAIEDATISHLILRILGEDESDKNISQDGLLTQLDLLKDDIKSTKLQITVISHLNNITTDNRKKFIQIVGEYLQIVDISVLGEDFSNTTLANCIADGENIAYISNDENRDFGEKFGHYNTCSALCPYQIRYQVNPNSINEKHINKSNYEQANKKLEWVLANINNIDLRTIYDILGLIESFLRAIDFNQNGLDNTINLVIELINNINSKESINPSQLDDINQRLKMILSFLETSKYELLVTKPPIENNNQEAIISLIQSNLKLGSNIIKIILENDRDVYNDIGFITLRFSYFKRSINYSIKGLDLLKADDSSLEFLNITIEQVFQIIASVKKLSVTDDNWMLINEINQKVMELILCIENKKFSLLQIVEYESENFNNSMQEFSINYNMDGSEYYKSNIANRYLNLDLLSKFGGTSNSLLIDVCIKDTNIFLHHNGYLTKWQNEQQERVIPLNLKLDKRINLTNSEQASSLKFTTKFILSRGNENISLHLVGDLTFTDVFTLVNVENTNFVKLELLSTKCKYEQNVSNLEDSIGDSKKIEQKPESDSLQQFIRSIQLEIDNKIIFTESDIQRYLNIQESLNNIVYSHTQFINFDKIIKMDNLELSDEIRAKLIIHQAAYLSKQSNSILHDANDFYNSLPEVYKTSEINKFINHYYLKLAKTNDYKENAKDILFFKIYTQDKIEPFLKYTFFQPWISRQ